MAKRVSRGISELLANVEDVREERRPDETKVISVAISKISPDPGQPRKTFNDESLEELALSIKEHGIIQPLIVKKDGNNYLIIAGERRYRAAEKIGLKELPVIVRDFNEQKAREISLIGVLTVFFGKLPAFRGNVQRMLIPFLRKHRFQKLFLIADIV